MNNKIKNIKDYKNFLWAQPIAPAYFEGDKYLSSQARESVNN